MSEYQLLGRGSLSWLLACGFLKTFNWSLWKANSWARMAQGSLELEGCFEIIGMQIEEVW